MFLLRQQSDFLQIISKFYNEIFTQFGKCIKIFQSDNALEYMQSIVNDFSDARGIIHQTSCAHTSRQNGFAKQKHRHLLDVARTLMFNMHIPKQF